MKRTQIYLDTDQDGRLARRATAAGVTKSALIREAVEAYLATPGDADEVADFRAALADLEEAPIGLPEGREYVEAVRAGDLDRQLEIERRRP